MKYDNDKASINLTPLPSLPLPSPFPPSTVARFRCPRLMQEDYPRSLGDLRALEAALDQLS